MTQTGQLAAQLSMDAALERVESSGWAKEARKCVAALCREQVEFTSDDVHRRVGDPPGSGNAVGALFRQIANEGWIELTPWSVPSTRPSARGRRLPVWRSKS